MIRFSSIIYVTILYAIYLKLFFITYVPFTRKFITFFFKKNYARFHANLFHTYNPILMLRLVTLNTFESKQKLLPPTPTPSAPYTPPPSTSTI